MREESRKKILVTAGRLFALRGFFNVHIAEIAKEAGMSPGNIYWYFPGKEDILKAILANVFRGGEEALIAAENWPGNGLEKLGHLIDLELKFFGEHGNDFQIYMSILGHGGNLFIKDLGFDTLQIGAGYHRRLAGILNEAMQEGSIPAHDPQLVTMLFFAFFNGLLITYGQDWQQFPPIFIRRAVLRLLGLHGEG